MTDTVAVPVWFAVLATALMVWLVATKLLMPSLRWFFRKRINRLITELNKQLQFQLRPVVPTRRRHMIERLTYDTEVMQEVKLVCDEEGAPYEVAMERVAGYAREIVPAFNPYLYFKLVSGLCNAILSSMYRVRLGYVDQPGIAAIDREASIVLVINHRSNVDYLLVTLLALRGGALSYAVGEWARVWPLQQFIRALGGYFVRRGSGNPLYRKVLERYVQLTLEDGAVQAMFPEGGLSHDGRLREPRIGLIDYMLRRFDPESSRDIVFIPVAVNYDRVLEDRTLLLDVTPNAERRSGWQAILTALRFGFRNLWQRLRGRHYRHGYASANFGTPISLKAYLRHEDLNPTELDRERRIEVAQRLAKEFMAEIAALVPVLPVSGIAYLLLDKTSNGIPIELLRAEARQLIEKLVSCGVHVHIPRDDPGYAIDVGLRMLMLRRVVRETPKGILVEPGEEHLLAYYANAIEHLVRDLGSNAD